MAEIYYKDGNLKYQGEVSGESHTDKESAIGKMAARFGIEENFKKRNRKEKGNSIIEAVSSDMRGNVTGIYNI